MEAFLMNYEAWKRLRKKIFERDFYTCHYCLKQLFADAEDDNLRPTIDHVVPKSKNGKNNWHNLLTACRDCNFDKRDRDYRSYLLYVRARLGDFTFRFPGEQRRAA
jgi:5-methylcytosine-specific restriction endonuclease McrA